MLLIFFFSPQRTRAHARRMVLTLVKRELQSEADKPRKGLIGLIWAPAVGAPPGFKIPYYKQR